ncbi:MAG: sigma 54-interacting transcriptional regulator, partial [Planctomycetota bacterium]
QAKLLRVLQERSFERVGSSTTISVDVRVIATTNRDLLTEVERGSFRQDLYYRLNVLPVMLPALRERSEDVRELAPHFVQMVCRREGRTEKRFAPDALELLVNYAWAGNVRELQNLCERAVVLSAGDEIEAALIRGWLGLAQPRRAMPLRPNPAVTAPSNPAAIAAIGNGQRLGAPTSMVESVTEKRWLVNGEPKPLADIEREIIVETLQRFGGHRQKTASALGIGVRTLGLKLNKWKEEQIVPQTL